MIKSIVLYVFIFIAFWGQWFVAELFSNVALRILLSSALFAFLLWAYTEVIDMLKKAKKIN